MSAASEDVREVSVESSLISVVSKAELDQQIATAHAWPRSLKRFRDECLQMATLSEAIADECIYAVPRKDQGVTKMIEGPSARLAEIVASAWGNCRAGARVVDEGRDFITAQGVFHDLERNVAITYEVRRKIVGKYGRFNADMIAVTGNAACSIALRNAVFKGVPKAFWNDIYNEARRVVAGDAKTLANRRSEALAHFQKLGATQERVLAVLGLQGVEDITLDHLVQLRGLANSVKEGEMSVDEAFPEPKAEQPAGGSSRAAAAAAALGAGASGAAAPASAGSATGSAPAADKDHVPQYDDAGAIGAIKSSKTIASLDKIWALIKEDYSKSGRTLPVEVDGAYSDRKAALNQL
jgi:hypothetical protein